MKENEELRAQNKALNSLKELNSVTISEMEAKVKRYEEKIVILEARLAKRYRKASEKMIEGQLYLFDELEQTEAEGTHNDKEEDSGKPDEDEGKRRRKYTRHKAKNAVLTLPANTDIIVKKMETEAPFCDTCGTKKVKVGERTVDSVVKTTSYAIVRRIYDVYACPNCEDTTPETVKTGNMLESTIADPLLLADCINEKFNMGVPLYRMERNFKELGINISRQTLSAWMMMAGRRLVDNLEPLIEEELYKMALINTDETPFLVLSLKDEEGKKKAPNSKTNCFLMARVGTGQDGKPGLCLFNFLDNRRNETIMEYFKTYHGVLQSDGLSGYDYAENKLGLKHCDCLVHARRKAADAAGDRKTGLAYEMVKKYKKIFDVEAEWNEKRDTLSEEEFIRGRKGAMLPLFEEFRTFLQKEVEKVKAEGNTLSNETSIAVSYFLSRYEKLTAFLDFYFTTSSNQIAERYIRSLITSVRNNSLFCINEDGAEVSCLYASLVSSCRNLEINPTDYLCHLFLNANLVKDGDREGWRKLLPGFSSIDDAVEHRKFVQGAKPDPDRTEDYILRGKKI